MGHAAISLTYFQCDGHGSINPYDEVLAIVHNFCLIENCRLNSVAADFLQQKANMKKYTLTRSCRQHFLSPTYPNLSVLLP